MHWPGFQTQHRMRQLSEKDDRDNISFLFVCFFISLFKFTQLNSIAHIFISYLITNENRLSNKSHNSKHRSNTYPSGNCMFKEAI